MPRLPDPKEFEAKAGEVADVLKLLGNRSRLMVLCTLTELKRARVGDLADRVGLSQSALSQHLARMREEGLVIFEREAQTIWYEIADPRIEQLLHTLYTLYCLPEGQEP